MTRKNDDRRGVACAKVYLQDARDFVPSMEGQFDLVIVDAPCSAMGLMGHQPDIRFARKPEDIESLSKIQLQILGVCALYVKQGGTLAYMTCSINKEENEYVTDAFLSESSGFSYSKPPQTLYPHLCGSDGFYFAVMRKQ